MGSDCGRDTTPPEADLMLTPYWRKDTEMPAGRRLIRKESFREAKNVRAENKAEHCIN